MVSFAHHPSSRRPARPRWWARTKMAAVLAALALHVVLVAGLAGVWHSSTLETMPAPQIVLLSLVSPPVEPESVLFPTPEAMPEPVPEVEADSVQARPAPVPAAPAGAGDVAEPADILTADGGQAGFAPDASRQGGAARSVACAVASGQLREAMGCDGTRDGAFESFTAHADADTVARIDRAFVMAEEEPAVRVPTANLAPMALPGQTFSQHSHYVSGAHSAFGRLPVSDRTRDPGFGD